MAERLITPLVRRPSFDLSREVAEPLPGHVTSALLGIPVDDIELLAARTDDVFSFFGAGIASEDCVRRAHAGLGFLRGYFEEQLGRRRVEASSDLLGWLVEAEREAPTLEEGELAGIAMTLLAGAFGTTTHLIGNAVLALMSQRAAWDALVADPSIAPSVVEEAFRYDGPALAVQRRTREPMEIGGRLIEAHQRVYCMLHAANHDPAMFPHPELFDPRRSPNRHLGLGGGSHFCLGASLTRLETAVVLEVLAETMPGLSLAGECPRHGSLAMRGVGALPVRPGTAQAMTSRHDVVGR